MARVFIPGPLNSLQKVVSGSKIQISARNVPHLVVDMGDTTFSACWFGKGGFFRVFWPYPSHGQKQSTKDCKTIAEVKEFLDNPG